MDENKAYFDNLSNTEPERGVSPENAVRASQPVWNAVPPERPPKRERGSGKGLFIGGLITGIGGALLVLGICYLGLYIQNIVESSQRAAEQPFEFSEDSALNEKVLKKIQMLERTIDQNFYLGEVTDEEIQDGIYRGIMASLGDPYSEYYSAEELSALMEQTEGIYYGIGAYISLDQATSLPKISGTIQGAPSEDAGLRANDLIYEVDGVSTYGMSLTEVVSLIKGPEDTSVKLTIIREGASDYLEVSVTRKQVETPTVEYAMMEDNMAYVQITEFDDVSVKQFENALNSAMAAGMKGLILDLRANPGGSLNAVVEMARMILPKGMIVYTEDKNGKRSEYTCDGTKELEVPLVVLVDMNSASASEIMAGAIKDYSLGTLVGTTTFGKGIVQQIMPFRDGSAVKITISAYYTPKGNNIHGIGIEPDVVCEFDGEAYYGSEDHPDNQLEKAKEVLRDKMR
ncbi:MAG: S41 family peptidase [Lachnospiraceae bacterium]|nr:S41 family peptidase [Lachnospiraceae bacterium]